MTTKKSSLKRPERLTEKLTAVNGRVADMISGAVARPKLTKLLLNVTVERSLVPVHVLISPESTVGDLIAAVLQQYSKEGRRPVIEAFNYPGFDLHYSQFCLERLSRDEKLNELGSRNFFLCSKQSAAVVGSNGGVMTASPSSSSSSTCSEDTGEVMRGGAVLFRFMEFML
ncbi:hypothetical protein HanIR_Chr02g0094041 [Helianthus annuus]|nr:hypothetical protein HanIR_Chr02g0094041 [Helianthus annuus]